MQTLSRAGPSVLFGHLLVDRVQAAALTSSGRSQAELSESNYLGASKTRGPNMDPNML